MKFAVIGAGLAGLVFGAMAVKDGHEVIIYDKNPSAGGVLALCESGGYRFEQGPLLMCDLLPGEPEEYEGPYWRRERLKKLFPEDADGLDR